MGIVGPLTPLPVSRYAQSVGRSRSMVVAVNLCSRLECPRLSTTSPTASHSIPSLSLPLPPARSNRAPIQQLGLSLAVAVVFNSAPQKAGKGGAEGGRGRGNIVVNARSCERVRCLPLLPLLPLINVVSLPSFSNERNEQRQKPLRPQDDHHRRCPLF